MSLCLIPRGAFCAGPRTNFRLAQSALESLVARIESPPIATMGKSKGNKGDVEATYEYAEVELAGTPSELKNKGNDLVKAGKFAQVGLPRESLA